MKKFILYSIALLLLITAFSFTDVVRNEFKWSKVMLDEAANSTAYWNASGDATTGPLPFANGGTGLTTLGTAGQVLQVNAGATGLEFGAGGSGITNGAANTELMMSDGTNAVSSNLFKTVDGSSNTTLSTGATNPTLRIISNGTNHLILGDILRLDPANDIIQINPTLVEGGDISVTVGGNLSLFGLGITIGGYAYPSGDPEDIAFLGNAAGVGGTATSSGDISIYGGASAVNGVDAGHLFLDGGSSSGTGLPGNISLFKRTPNFGGGSRVLFFGDYGTAPTTNPTDGFLLYADDTDGSNPYVRTPAGTVHKLTHSMMNVTIATATTAIGTHPNSEQQLQNANNSRTNVESTYFNQVRLVGRVSVGSASANDPRLYIQYTTDLTGATGWTTIGAATTASGDALDLTDIGNEVTDWLDLPAGAKADVLYRIAQNGGDGAASPTLVNLHIQFK